MIIARAKRNQNIVEYLLYMFQVEDTIRACKFDMKIIEERVISQFRLSEGLAEEVRNWYANLIVSMHEEKITETGHLSELLSLIDTLNALHQKLLRETTDEKYREQYMFARPNILEFQKKLGSDTRNEIYTCLLALYALLLLRLQKKTVTQETREAMQTFSNLLGLLGAWFMKAEGR
ncbi:MAG: DUF4924 family protein [Bacteroidales bacterium]|nr:DUF4924 family protein [Bacteroidales bacterium]